MCMAHEASSSHHWTEKDIKARCVPMTDKQAVEIVNTFHKKMESSLDSHVCGVCGVAGLDGNGSLVPIPNVSFRDGGLQADEVLW